MLLSARNIPEKKIKIFVINMVLPFERVFILFSKLISYFYKREASRLHDGAFCLIPFRVAIKTKSQILPLNISFPISIIFESFWQPLWSDVVGRGRANQSFRADAQTLTFAALEHSWNRVEPREKEKSKTRNELGENHTSSWITSVDPHSLFSIAHVWNRICLGLNGTHVEQLIKMGLIWSYSH